MTINEIMGLMEEAEDAGLITVEDKQKLEEWLEEQGYSYER